MATVTPATVFKTMLPVPRAMASLKVRTMSALMAVFVASLAGLNFKTIGGVVSGNKPVASAIWKFYLSGDGKTNRAPSAAKAIYPVPGSTINLNVTGGVKFEWSSEDLDKDILTYTIRIDTLNSNQKLSGNSFDTKNPFQEIKLQQGKIYYWSVVTKDESISIKSDVFSFKLK